jgi:hypothetical protein
VLAASWISENILAWYNFHNKSTNTVSIIYLFVEFFLLSVFYFYSAKKIIKPKIFILSTLIIYLIIIFISIKLLNQSIINGIPISISSIYHIVVSAIIILYHNFSEKVSFSNNVIIIIFGLLFFNTTTSLIYLFSDFLYASLGDDYKYVWNIHLAVSIISNFIFAFALWKPIHK